MPLFKRSTDRFRLPLLLTGLVMYTLSWRVWTYQELYPAIPFFSRIPYLGPAPSWLLFAAMLAAFTLCLSGVRDRATCAAYLLASAALIFQDQHRLQPWAYHFALCALILCWAEVKERAALILLLTAGIYFHSGLQKLNYSFVVGTGTVLLDVLINPLGVTTSALPFPLLAAAALAMGVGELALAPGLFFTRTRKYAAGAAIAMHLTILYCLGPWNMGWNVIVWPWNLLMIAFNTSFLLAPEDASPSMLALGSADHRFRWALPAVLLVALFLPLLRFADRFDAYPSFGMYIDYYHQSDLFVLWDEADRLPEPIRKQL